MTKPGKYCMVKQNIFVYDGFIHIYISCVYCVGMIHTYNIYIDLKMEAESSRKQGGRLYVLDIKTSSSLVAQLV